MSERDKIQELCERLDRPEAGRIFVPLTDAQRRLLLAAVRLSEARAAGWRVTSPTQEMKDAAVETEIDYVRAREEVRRGS